MADEPTTRQCLWLLLRRLVLEPISASPTALRLLQHLPAEMSHAVGIRLTAVCVVPIVGDHTQEWFDTRRKERSDGNGN